MSLAIKLIDCIFTLFETSVRFELKYLCLAVINKINKCKKIFVSYLQNNLYIRNV